MSQQGDEQGISIDSEEVDDGSSYGGFKARVYLESGHPLIVIGSSNDDDKALCFEFIETYEADSYDPLDTDAWSESGQLDFGQDINVSFVTIDSETFSAIGKPAEDGVGKFSKVNITFHVQTEDGDTNANQYGIEFSYELYDYVWESSSDNDTRYVLECKFYDCSDDYSADDGDDGDSSDSEDRRRLGSDSDEGISSDDSNEFDVDVGTFINTPTAYCIDGSGDINVELVATDSDSSRIYLAFSRFDCDMRQDPWFTADINASLRSLPMFAFAFSLAVSLYLYIQ